MPERWRKRLFFIFLPLLLAGTWLGTRVDTDLNAFFTAVDSEDAAFMASLLQSGELSRRYIIAIRPIAEQTASVDAVADEFVRKVASLGGVERVWRTDRIPGDWFAAVKAAAPRHGNIFSLDPEQEGAKLFDLASLDGRAKALKRSLLAPEGPWVKDIARNDPLMLSLQAFRGLQGHLPEANAKGSQMVGVVLQSRPPALDTAAQSALQEAIRNLFDELNGQAGQAFRLAMTGVPVFSVQAHAQIARDVALVSTCSTLAVVLIFLFIFRSLWALLWVSLIVAASFAVGTIATSLSFGTVHSLTLALGSSLTGVSIDYPLHVMAHAGQFPGEPPVMAMRRVWTSLFAGAMTTVLGYVALGFTGFPGFRQMAVFSSAAILATLLLTRWVLPSLLDRSALVKPHLPGLDGWLDFCRRHRALLLGLLAIALCVVMALLPRIRWMDDLSKLSMDMVELKAQDREIRSGLTSIEPGRFVVVKGTDLEAALQNAEAAERVLRGLEQRGALRDHLGLYPWLVSAHLQSANGETYSRLTAGEFSSAWEQALRANGLSVEKLGRLSPAGPPVPAEAGLTSAVEGIVAGQIIRKPGGVALIVWLGDHDPAEVAAALKPLPEVKYFSQKDLLNSLAQRYRDQSLELLAWGLSGIYLLLWIRYRSFKKAFFSLFPALMACFALFAIWAALAQEVSFLHLMCLLLAVSICEDYGIFFLDNSGGDIRATYQAIAPSMLTTAASFAALGLAENPTLRILAVAVTSGVVLGFLLCPLLIRPKAPLGPAHPV